MELSTARRSSAAGPSDTPTSSSRRCSTTSTEAKDASLSSAPGTSPPLAVWGDMGFEAVDAPEDLICVVCNNLMTDPVQTTCDHHFCSLCLNTVFSTNRICPVCRKTDPETVPANRLIRSMISRQKVRCAHPNCGKEIMREEWEQHEAACEHIPVQCPHHLYGCRERVASQALQEHVASCAFLPKTYSHAVFNAKINVERANEKKEVIDVPLRHEGVLTHRNCLTFALNGDDLQVLRPGIVSVSVTVVARARDGWTEQHERYHGLGVQINGVLAAYSLFPRRVKKGDCVSTHVTHHAEVNARDIITFRIGMSAKKLIGDLQAKDISVRWDAFE